MNTALLWILIALPPQHVGSAHPSRPIQNPSVVARFADEKECQRVGAVLQQRADYIRVDCIQARVIIKD